MLELYQTENCPYCVKVRQELENLGLSYVVHNRSNEEIRKKLIDLGGKEQVPMLVDPHHDVMLYESEDIISHLKKQYGKKSS